MKSRLKECKPTGKTSEVLSSHMCERSVCGGDVEPGKWHRDGVKWSDLASV